MQQAASGFGELKQDLQQNVHPQLVALRLALEKMRAEVETMLAEVTTSAWLEKSPRSYRAIQGPKTRAEVPKKSGDVCLRTLGAT